MIERPVFGGFCLALCGMLQAQSPATEPAAPAKPAAKIQKSQEIQVNGLIHLWQTQMLDNDPRLNDAASSYYQLPEGGKENTTHVRRAEIHLTGSITPDITFKLVAAPQTVTSTTSPSILQDAYIQWKLNDSFSLRMGQFKPLQSYESSMQSTKDTYFYERSQLARRLGDKRDRGVYVTYSFGDPQALSGKFNVGVVNGMSEATGGRTPDTNAQKDVISRLEFSYGKHKFGGFTRDGSTDIADKGGVLGLTFQGAGAPTAQQVLDNKDKFTNRGLYYAYEDDTFLGQAEVATGLWGRRFPSVAAAAGTAKREHLDQKYLGYQVTLGYKFTPRHWVLGRIDHMNYNAGDDWYGPNNPYTRNVTTGASLNADYAPKYTDLILGYTFVLNPAKPALGKFMANYVKRPGNYLKPRPGQSGAQGGDHLVLNYIIAF